jgi:hypothetical protein
VTKPEKFAFDGRTDAKPGQLLESQPVTIRGINVPVAISVVNGEYSINSGAYISTPGTVSPGDVIRVRVRAAATPATSATLTIAGMSVTYSATTAGDVPAADTTPDSFGFSGQSGVAASAVVTSELVTIAGLGAPAPISVGGGEYSIDGGSFTAAPGTVSNGQTVRVRVTAPATAATTAKATVTIGGVTGEFEVTTAAAVAPPDTTPDAFSFASRSNAALNAVISSDPVVVAGINTSTPIAIVGGEYSVNGGGYTGGAGTVASGQSVTVRLISSASYATTSTATLTIGGISRTFSVTTENEPAPDHTPNAFSFATKTNVNPHTTQTSETVTITGVTAGTAISVVNGQYKLNNDNWTSVPGVLTSSDTVQVRHTAASGNLATNVTTLTIGTVSATFTTITKP